MRAHRHSADMRVSPLRGCGERLFRKRWFLAVVKCDCTCRPFGEHSERIRFLESSLLFFDHLRHLIIAEGLREARVAVHMRSYEFGLSTREEAPPALTASNAAPCGGAPLLSALGDGSSLEKLGAVTDMSNRDSPNPARSGRGQRSPTQAG